MLRGWLCWSHCCPIRHTHWWLCWSHCWNGGCTGTLLRSVISFRRFPNKVFVGTIFLFGPPFAWWNKSRHFRFTCWARWLPGNETNATIKKTVLIQTNDTHLFLLYKKKGGGMRSLIECIIEFLACLLSWLCFFFPTLLFDLLACFRTNYTTIKIQWRSEAQLLHKINKIDQFSCKRTHFSTVFK